MKLFSHEFQSVHNALKNQSGQLWLTNDFSLFFLDTTILYWQNWKLSDGFCNEGETFAGIIQFWADGFASIKNFRQKMQEKKTVFEKK